MRIKQQLQPRQQPQFRVGILGATGAVGQKFVEILSGHPWFDITALAASERSAGRRYGAAANWIGSTPIPPQVAQMEISLLKPNLDCDFVFSGLSASVAGNAEREFSEAGYPVISNARNYRMHADVPLLIPEINPDHTALIENQPWSGGGFIVTNPNCSTIGLTCALRPLHDAFGVEAVQVTTLQALSGAGHPGISSLDSLGNVLPFIAGEEEKMSTEPLKLLGELVGNRIEHASIKISAQCNRVPVLEGHLECVSLKLRRQANLRDVRRALEEFGSPIAEYDLPSEPMKLLHVYDDESFPQPRRHAFLDGGMGIGIGRLRECEVLEFKFVVLVHNTIRGAAGGAVLNAELLVRQGYLARATEAVLTTS